jgi:membrane protein YdbS with pleckstrin-like domain
MAPADEIARHRVLRRYLLDGERVVTAVHQHWAKVAEPVASAVLGLVLALWLDSRIPASAGHAADVLWWLWILVVVRAAWKLLEWRHDWFVATDKRLILTYGMVTQKVAMMPLSKVTDMSYNRSLMGRVAGFGTFVMESAGQDQALHHVNWVPEPDHTYRVICAEIFGVDDHDRVDLGDGDDDAGNASADDGGPDTGPAGGRGGGRGGGPGAGPSGGPGGLGRPPVPPAPGSPGDWSTGIRIRPVEPGEDERGGEGGRSLYRSPDLRPRGRRDADTGPIPILRPPTDP